MNKSLITNMLSFIITILGWLLDLKSLYCIGFFALSGSLTNWLAVHMIFEKVPLFYGSGVIRERFKEFRESIKGVILSHFFSQKSISAAIDQVGSEGIKVSEKDKDMVFESFKKIIMQSKFGSAIEMFGGADIINEFREDINNEIDAFATRMHANSKQQIDAASLFTTIKNILEQRVVEITANDVKAMVESVIKKHLEWIVVWGAVFGGILGLLFNVI